MEVAASVISIIQATGTLVEYLRAATDAPSDRRKLLLEANSLLALLTSLKDFLGLESQDDHSDWRRAVRRLESSNGPFAQYKNELEGLLKKLLPLHGLEKAAQTLLWKLNRDDVRETLLRIERMKTLVSIALEMDHMHLSEAIMSEVSAVSADTKVIKSDTLKLVNSLDEASMRVLLDQICPEDYASVYQSNLSEHTAGIGQNFIAGAAFQGWTVSGDDHVLLCLGDPGVGKTVMATKAIQALQRKTEGLNEAVAFVYCDCTRRRSRLNRRDSSPEARNKGVQTPGHFLASLLRQLVASVGSAPEQLKSMMENHARQKTRPRTEDLQTVFAVTAASLDRVYLVVDAIDECDGLEVEVFANLLHSISSMPSVRLLVTSRKLPQVEQLFESAVRLDLHAEENDTLYYLRSRAKHEFPQRVLRDPEALARVLQALLHSASGIPLVARLHMNALRGVRTPGAMLSALARLGSTSDVYDETYRATMERIMKQPGELPVTAMCVLRWVVGAKRYLYASELQCILAMQEDSNSLDDDFMPDIDDVFLACEGLICPVSSSDGDNVRLELVHTTARQYFEKQLAEWAPDFSLGLTQTCLTMLSFEDLLPLPKTLVAYALCHWGQHAKDVEDLSEELQFSTLTAMVESFLKSDKDDSLLAQKVSVYETPEHPRSMRGLLGALTGYHLVARFGLIRTFEALWCPEDDLDSILDACRMTPFHAAVDAGNAEMVRLMLTLKCADPRKKDAFGDDAVIQSIIAGHDDITELLLQSGLVDPGAYEGLSVERLRKRRLTPTMKGLAVYLLSTNPD